MVERIKADKDKILEHMDKELAKYGGDKIDVAVMEKLADMVKDLAEAEKECWEAEYYRAVTEAMGSSGYMPEGVGQQWRSGYNPNRDSMGRYARRGYSQGYHEHMEDIRSQMQQASPDEREKMKRELRQMLDM